MKIFVVAYNRQSALDQLLAGLEGHEVTVFDDWSTPSLKAPRVVCDGAHRGKQEFWKLINSVMAMAKKCEGEEFLFLADDMTPTPGCVDKALQLLHSLPGTAKAINVLCDGRTASWTGIERAPYTDDLYTAGFIDGAFICDYAFLQAVGFKVGAISLDRWKDNPTLSSGVWCDVTKRALKAGVRLFQVQETLFGHGDYPSQMNSEERKRAPLIATPPPVRQDNETSSAGMSVIVAAWKVAPFLEKLIDSFAAQENNSKIPLEMLIAVDGCPETKEKLERMTLPGFVRTFWSPANVGPYIIFNSLVPLATYPYIMFFGADDTALPCLVDQHVLRRMRCDMVANRADITRKLAEGAFGIWKSSWDKVGGFRPWRCGADSEFRERAPRVGVARRSFPDIPTYVRGHHPNQLSRLPETAKNSPIRNSYVEQIAQGRKERLKRIVPEVTPLEPLGSVSATSI